MLYKNRKHYWKKLTSLKLMLRTTIMTPVEPRISKFQPDKMLPRGLQRAMAALLMSIYLSEWSRPYMLAYYLSAFIDCAYFLSHVLKKKHDASNVLQVLRGKKLKGNYNVSKTVSQYSPV
jgi:hypothetical protein